MYETLLLTLYANYKRIKNFQRTLIVKGSKSSVWFKEAV